MYFKNTYFFLIQILRSKYRAQTLLDVTRAAKCFGIGIRPLWDALNSVCHAFATDLITEKPRKPTLSHVIDSYYMFILCNNKRFNLVGCTWFLPTILVMNVGLLTVHKRMWIYVSYLILKVSFLVFPWTTRGYN